MEVVTVVHDEPGNMLLSDKITLQIPAHEYSFSLESYNMYLATFPMCSFPTHL